MRDYLITGDTHPINGAVVLLVVVGVALVVWDRITGGEW